MKIIAKKILGIILILVGLFALLTPFSPGSWLALIGLELLGFGVLLENKILSLLKPRQRQKIENLLHKVRCCLRLRRSAAKHHTKDKKPDSPDCRNPDISG